MLAHHEPADDLAIALAVPAVRIVAPIPGKPPSELKSPTITAPSSD